jgi:SpoVK/Ycf46/Vps4 family AAA+-type ATPase
MKKQTHLSQKFQKKYFFFQKSFFDFLYWRSTQKAKPELFTELRTTPLPRDFSAFEKSGKFEEQTQIQMQLNSVQKFYPFQQEKMSFYQYWKRDSLSGDHKNIQNTFKSSTKGTAIQSKFFEFSQKNKQKKSFLFLKDKKKTKIFSNSKKSLSFLTTQKFHFLFLKKRKEKMSQFQKKNFKNESFLPITSSFEISQNLELSAQWTKSQKIGEFFPKKKNFIQYWIFPFLGVLFFFSQNVSFLLQQRDKKAENIFSFEPFQVLNTGIHPDSFSCFSSNQSQFSSKKSFFNFQRSEQNEIIPFEYFFAQKNFTKTEFFQNLEKTEYEEFFKFYNQIFQNTLSSSSFNLYLTNSTQFSLFAKPADFDLLQQNFQKNQVSQANLKRNCYNWKWFSLSSNFLNSQFLTSVSLQIPQKAEFFVVPRQSHPQSGGKALQTVLPSTNLQRQKQPSLDSHSLIEKTKKGNIEKPSTPLFEYSKNLFLANELKRNFYLAQFRTTFPSFFSDSSISEGEEKKPFSFLKTYEMHKFFKNQVSFDLNQKEKLFAKDFDLFFQNSEKMSHLHSVLPSGENKNRYFLNKWAKTQKFSLLQKSDQKKISKNISPQTLSSFLKIQKSIPNGNREGSFQKNLKQTKNGKISQKLNTLDALYLQKLFQKFTIQNFGNRVQSELFQNNQKQLLGNKKSSFFYNFKKQTYGFFIFQHYNKNYKKFLNSFVSKSSLSNKLRTNFLFTFKTKSKKEKIVLPLTYQVEGFSSVQSIPPLLQSSSEMKFSTHSSANPKSAQVFPEEKQTSSFGQTGFKKRDVALLSQQKSQTISDLSVPSAVEKFNSPILFFFPQNSNFGISTLGGMDQKNETLEFYHSGHKTKNLYPHNFYGQKFSFSFFPELKERNTKEFLFFDHKHENNRNISFTFFNKLDRFRTFQFGSLSEIVGDENFLKKNFYNFFSKVYMFQNFEKNFLVETNRDQKPLFFQKNTNFSFENSKNRKKDVLFQSESRKLNQDKEMESCFYILKSKKRLSFLQYENYNKGIQSNFSGLSKKQRKFEKTFRAFFSPLKETKNLFSFGTLSQKELNTLSDKTKAGQSKSGFSTDGKQNKQIFYNKGGQQDSMTEMNKTLKDLVLLQSLSDLLKKNSINFSQSFYLPTNRKSLKRKKIEMREQTPFLKEKTKSFLSFSQSPNELPLAENQKMRNKFQKSHLSPQLVLKRDGFLSLSSQNSFLHGSDFNKSQEKKSFALQRLEKEKNFQKKRRLKKEKLETRRRKKRKRFFPRPVWLRMNLYKKFLKIRHSKKTFSFFQNKEKNISSFFNDKKRNLLSMQTKTNSWQFNGCEAEQISVGMSLTKTKKEKWFQKTEQKQLDRYFSKKSISMNRNKASCNQYGKKIHFLKRSSDFQNSDIDSLFFKKQHFNFQSKTYQKNYQKENWRRENSLFSLTKDFETEKFSKNVNHYKISNEIYQEFLRLSWKSSWFQNNFKPYTQTILSNFKKIQSIESEKNFSHFFDILKSKNSLFFFHDFPIFSEKSLSDFLIRKSVFQKFSWYSNVQNSFSSRGGPNFLKTERFLSGIENKTYGQFSGKENPFKISEYNRILYARISEVLKKMKFSENMTNDSFFESLKGNRRKNEKIFSGSKNSFFTKTALFLEKFQVPSQPVIPAFSVFSSVFHDFSIKPTGDIPTLRAMWAFQKTNFSHFIERNSIQNLWAFKKRKDALASFKGTKKIMNFLRKYNGFEKLKMPKEFSSDWSLFAIPKHKKTLNTFLNNPSFIYGTRDKKDFSFTFSFDRFHDIQNTSISPKNTMSKTFFLANKKDDFLRHSVSAERNLFLNQLDALTLQKFRNVEKKSSVFGIQSFKQNSKISYRYLKYHLSPFSQKSVVPPQGEKSQNQFSSLSKVERNNEISKLFSTTFLKNKNPQNSAKSSLNFWWVQKPFQNFDFLGSSQFQTFADFSNKKPFSFVGEQKKNFLSSPLAEEQFFFSNISFLLFGAFFFHFAVFYTLFKIPEIRSVFKFTVLLFSKFVSSFFLVFFSIYNIFKRYTQNGLAILKSSSFSEKKNFKNEKNPIFSVDQKNFSSEKEFLNLLLHMPFSQTSHSFLLAQSINGIKNGKNTKFDSFIFEFFPRFSSFSGSMHSFLSSSDKLTNKKKLFYHFPATGVLFQKGNRPFANLLSQKTNFREIFSKTNMDKNLHSVFVFQISQNDIFSKKALFSNFYLPLEVEKAKMNFFASSPQRGLQSSMVQNIQFSKTEKNLSQFALSFLVFGKQILFIPYTLFQFASSISTKIFEIVEGIFYAFYKFLEKPAEFMIEFIAFVFLIEWSSDILGFFPDSIESSLWKSSQKLLRPVRTGTFFYSFGIFIFGTSAKSLSQSSSLSFQTNQSFSLFNPFQFLLSTGYFQFSNFAAYVLQKRLLYVFENIPSILLQPDIDILVRQRKGIIFWDIWAEILLKAAEKYNVNLPSFVTLKEEQELFIEKLVRDSEFFKTFSHSSSNEENISKSFSAFSDSALPSAPQSQNLGGDQNFILQNRPFNFYDFSFLSRGESSLYSSLFQKGKNTQKLLQFSISNLFSLSPSAPMHLFHNKGPNGRPSVSFFQALGQKQFGQVENLRDQSRVSNSFLQKQGMNEKEKTFFPLFGPETPTLHFLQNTSKKSKKFLNLHSFATADDSLSSFQNMKKMDRWQCNQYSTFQSQETDFFLDIYPPKSLKHVHFLKYYEPAQYTLGSFICQIYAGIFPKQISKNILVVGESGTAKTFFLRALAGETEMKIITENASRYAIVQRGVAVGMKYLRDVFDAIALQTPCFFVMEDLHIIGAKRPFMISENENTQNVQSSFGLEQQEVHETNQMIYQSSRHSVSDFRRPYKGDFSMGIATNYFLQTFYSSFFSTAGTEQNGGSSHSSHDSSFYSLHKKQSFQNSQFFGGNFSSSVWNSLSSPLPIDSLEAILQNTGIQEKEKSNFESFSNKKNVKKIQSILQFSKEQIFAPPATSPFTVLMMKEQKKLKPKKIVQETSWGGLSADQILLYQKESSSIRAKIAVLAEKTMNLSRGKFDMITDFLVIIDSVRSNRGFVVFGTTHKPSSLDPALRRPGRFDETLSLSRTPNFLNRFEIFKMNFENSVSTFDFFDASILTENFSEIDLFDILSQTKLSFFHNYKYDVQKFYPRSSFISQYKNSESKTFHEFEPAAVSTGAFLSHPFAERQKEKLTVQNQVYSQISPTKAFQTLLKSPLFEDFYTQKQFISSSMQYKSKSEILDKNFPFSLRNSNFFLNQSYTVLPKGPSHMVSLAYSKLGIFLAESNLFHSCHFEKASANFIPRQNHSFGGEVSGHGYPFPTAFVQLNLDIEKNSSKRSNFQQYYANVFFDPVQGQKNRKNLQLMVFLSGKIAEFFVCSSENKNLSSFQTSHSQFCVPNAEALPRQDKQTFTSSFEKGHIPNGNDSKVGPTSQFYTVENSVLFEKPFSFFSKKFDIFESSVEKISRFEKKEKNFSLQSGDKIVRGGNFPYKKKNVFSSKGEAKMLKSSAQQSLPAFKKDFYWTVYGNDETWRFATPFLHSLIQKRFLFTKNLLLSKMLFFENMDQRRKPPNPPASSILMPSKKYENFKRTETDFFQKAYFSIHEKIQMHQKQRFLKQLYNIPVQTYFRSELRKNHKTLFSSSFQEFAYLDSFVQRSSSSHSYYKKYIQVRHRFSNVNQWWNGMFPEHTREMTYLSDVDWRTMFVSSPNNSQQQNTQINQVDSNINKGEISMNFSGAPHMKTFEFLMDFPDAEQYYNPRNRRWFFKSKSNSQYAEKSVQNSTFWSIFEKDLQYEIFSHFLMESFYESFSYFEKKREMLDFFVFHLLSKGFLKEIDFLTTFSRF